MAEEIRIGEAILNYTDDISAINERIMEAYKKVVECKMAFEGESIYKGKAKNEILLYLASLEANIQKLLFLYNAASTFINNTYLTFYYDEQQLVDHIIKTLGESE